MKEDFIEELRWRGLIHNITIGVENYLKEEQAVAYVGIDPTADSLHVGHLVSIMMLKHFQNFGHKPIILIGGATGMIGDPSGKSEERPLLETTIIQHNIASLQKQLLKLLDFNENIPNGAILVNNYDWIRQYSFIDFIRLFGKYITVNYMISKDFIKKRISEDSSGLSFTEFSYQLVQAVDFLYLFENYNCKLQMGGSDQWGNITTGIELIRKKLRKEAYAITSPLITKADEKKFGKTEEGNIWLDPQKTSPYTFYQFWINQSDEDAAKYIKIFTTLEKETIENLITTHFQHPHKRELQKTLAKEIMFMLGLEKDYKIAQQASEILFGNETINAIKEWDNLTIENIFKEIPNYKISKDIIKNSPQNIVEFLTTISNILPSKSEARRMLKSKAILINKVLVDENYLVSENDIINNKYILIQTGKKNFHLVNLE